MNSDDPKLTAYALDELDPAERAEIEQFLRENPAAHTEVEETKAFSARLSQALKREPAAPLTETQHATVLAVREEKTTVSAHEAAAEEDEETGRRAGWMGRWLPIAAVFVVLASVSAAMITHLENHAGKPRPKTSATLGSAGERQILQVFPLGIPAPAPEPPRVMRVGPPDLPPAPPPPEEKSIPESLGTSLKGSGAGLTGVSSSRGMGVIGSTGSQSPGSPAGGPAARATAIRSTEQGAAALRIDRGSPAKNQPAPAIAPETSSPDTEAYDSITDNAFLAVRENPLSTFSIDVDTASYANVRRFLNQQTRPPKGAVRIEELLNYFNYDYPQPAGDAPFSATMEVAACPWEPEHRLVRIGLKGREIAKDKRPASNLVFLIDVSGSMQPENKLPLLKQSLRLLVDQLTPEDSVAIAVYAGASGTVLEPTRDRGEIRAALDRLESGGSTNGAAGIQLAYRLAEQSFIKGGVNRVILATDGDFNVGLTSQSELTDLVTRKAKSGVFLTVLGFGMGNLKDSTLETLADKGNGNYAYIDTLNEGRKVLVEQMSGTLVTIAKDVKIQVEFNPAQVGAYRLIGYENRLLAKEDFNDDKKDAGEIGAGHTVTALYEVVPAGARGPVPPAVDPLKYQAPGGAAPQSPIANRQSAISPELLTLKLRYKQPDGDKSKLLEFPLTDRGETWEKSSRDFRFAAAVAGFGMLLRDSPHKGRATWDSVRELAMEGRGEDRSGYRGEFLTLLDKAKALTR